MFALVVVRPPIKRCSPLQLSAHHLHLLSATVFLLMLLVFGSINFTSHIIIMSR